MHAQIIYAMCTSFLLTKVYLVCGWNNKLGCKLMYFIEYY